MFNSQEFKAGLVCMTAFVLGCLVAFSGCSNRSRVIGIQSPVDGVYTVVQPPVCGQSRLLRYGEKARGYSQTPR